MERIRHGFYKLANNFDITDEQKNLSNLSKYAKEMGLFKRVNDLMEVMSINRYTPIGTLT